MWNNAVYVDDSKIQGKGLIAKIDISKSEIIVDYRDVVWHKKSVHELTEYEINHQWIVMLEEDMCEITDGISEIIYINHSRTPNTNWLVEQKYITAARDIKAGEEITIDYRLEKRSNRTKFPDWI